jgi:LysM repeat protein
MFFDVGEDSSKVKFLNLAKNKNLIHKVEYGETIEKIAKLYNQTKENLIKVNNLKNGIEQGDRLIIPQKNIAIYVVKPLDSLSKIAYKFDVTEEHIKKENNIDKVFIGQVLVI